jgi:hypothetical protein
MAAGGGKRNGAGLPDLGIEAYIYLYPLLRMEISRRQQTNVEAGVRPTFDTLYSSAWLDLTSQPMIVSAPDTGGRYHLLPRYDMWTDVFAAPGKRTSGTQAAHYAVAPPGWQGTFPRRRGGHPGPNPASVIIGRTQSNGPRDYDAVHVVQDGYTITPLSDWGKNPARVEATIDPTVDMTTPPLQQVNDLPAAAYFTAAAELLKLHPPHHSDWSMLARMRRIGIHPGQSFEFDRLNPVAQGTLERVPADALKLMQDKLPTLAP